MPGVRHTGRPSFVLVAAVAWSVLWGVRTLGVRSLDALTANSLAVYPHVGVAAVGAVAVLAGAKVARGGLVARGVLVLSLVVFAAVEVPAVVAGSPTAVAVVATHLASVAAVVRAAPKVETGSAPADPRVGAD
jgi:hypothetical protein